MEALVGHRYILHGIALLRGYNLAGSGIWDMPV